MIVIALLTAAFVPFGRINVSAESTVTVTAAEFGKENGQEVTSATVKGISFEFAQSTASNPPKYYSSPSAVRTYKNNKGMATKKETDTVDKQIYELFEVLLKKSGVKKKDLMDIWVRSFIKENLDLVSESDKKKFDKLVF